MDTDKPPHPGVYVPPPLIYVVALGAGWLIHGRMPLPLASGASTLREIAAFGFIAIYLALFSSALTTFRRARTTIIPSRPAAALVTEGPFRLSRNPMYVSLVMLYVGISLLLNTWWTLALLPFVLLIIDRMVIAREERYLAAAFPVEYAEYRARVRRWL